MIRGRGQRQFTTGLTVNDIVSVPAEYRREIRQEMYYIGKYGLHSHLEKTGVETEEAAYLLSLLGRIRYVLSVRGTEEFRKYEASILGLIREAEEYCDGRDH